MLGDRIRQYRLARGLSQDQLVERIGGIVTKASISKYETYQAKPSNSILNKIASALNVKAAVLYSEPSVDINFIGYRKGSGLSASAAEKIEANIRGMLEEYIKLKNITNPESKTKLSVQSIPVKNLEDAETAAEQMRKTWKLGISPISNVTATLEDNGVFVINSDVSENFDGISAYAKDNKNNILAATVVSQKNIPGERQRLNLAHELGHIVLNIDESLDEEKVAFRFGGAFLAPREMLYKEIGTKRSALNIAELLLLKDKLGLSLQALVYRLNELKIISDSYKNSFFVFVNKKGWKKNEPQPREPERPSWLKLNIYKAYSEGLLTLNKAEEMLGEKLNNSEIIPSKKRRAFMKLSAAEKNKLLSSQVTTGNEIDSDWLDMGVDYESGK